MIKKIFLFILLAPSIVFSKPNLYEYHFTVHTNDFEPVVNYEGFSFYQDKIVLILRWKDIDPEKLNTIRYIIKDGLGHTVKDYNLTVKTDHGFISNYFQYKYNKNRDFPGDWYFYVWLDDELYLEEMIYISQ